VCGIFYMYIIYFLNIFLMFWHVASLCVLGYFVNLWRKLVHLFCFLSHQGFSKHNATCCTVGTIDEYGALSWCVGFITFQPMMKSSLNIEQIFFENLSNSKLKIVGNLGTLLVLLKSPYWVGFNEGDLEVFRLKSQERLNFEFFCYWKFN